MALTMNPQGWDAADAGNVTVGSPTMSTRRSGPDDCAANGSSKTSGLEDYSHALEVKLTMKTALLDEALQRHMNLQARLYALEEGISWKDAQLEAAARQTAATMRSRMEWREQSTRMEEENCWLRDALLERDDKYDQLLKIVDFQKLELQALQQQQFQQQQLLASPRRPTLSGDVEDLEASSSQLVRRLTHQLKEMNQKNVLLQEQLRLRSGSDEPSAFGNFLPDMDEPPELSNVAPREAYALIGRRAADRLLCGLPLPLRVQATGGSPYGRQHLPSDGLESDANGELMVSPRKESQGSEIEKDSHGSWRWNNRVGRESLRRLSSARENIATGGWIPEDLLEDDEDEFEDEGGEGSAPRSPRSPRSPLSAQTSQRSRVLSSPPAAEGQPQASAFHIPPAELSPAVSGGDLPAMIATTSSREPPAGISASRQLSQQLAVERPPDPRPVSPVLSAPNILIARRVTTPPPELSSAFDSGHRRTASTGTSVSVLSAPPGRAEVSPQRAPSAPLSVGSPGSARRASVPDMMRTTTILSPTPTSGHAGTAVASTCTRRTSFLGVPPRAPPAQPQPASPQGAPPPKLTAQISNLHRAAFGATPPYASTPPLGTTPPLFGSTSSSVPAGHPRELPRDKMSPPVPLGAIGAPGSAALGSAASAASSPRYKSPPPYSTGHVYGSTPPVGTTPTYNWDTGTPDQQTAMAMVQAANARSAAAASAAASAAAAATARQQPPRYG
eukprot:TRINITY_DN18713_c0_g1_i1.p1 TRINITY_DN18713_c0_g1~~TRINITY_DN18713_c0_g1_i1.p1  ORF type:complete len:731 (-),score=166.11 TRINITY_DN18713_c0_g1_i1:94-2286(-)